MSGLGRKVAFAALVCIGSILTEAGEEGLRHPALLVLFHEATNRELTAVLRVGALARAQKLGVRKVWLSLSHTQKDAVAMAVLES